MNLINMHGIIFMVVQARMNHSIATVIDRVATVNGFLPFRPLPSCYCSTISFLGQLLIYNMQLHQSLIIAAAANTPILSHILYSF